MTAPSLRISVFLARLLGPVCIAIAIGVLVNAAAYRGLAQEFLHNTALIYVTGLLGMTAGVAILLNHNAWVPDWRCLITLFGWLATIGGAQRIIWPQGTEAAGSTQAEMAKLLRDEYARLGQTAKSIGVSVD